MSVVRLSRLAFAAALGAALPATVAAQEIKNHLYPTLELDVSGTVVLYNTTLRVDPTNRPALGTEVSLEDDLGASNTNFQPRGALRWRPGRRHEIEVGFLRAIRSGDRALDRTITFRDTTFNVGVTTTSSFRTSQAFLNYRYAFRARDNSQIGAALGLGVIFLKATLTAAATAATNSFSSESKLNGPVASVGLYGRFRVGESWYLEADGRAVYVAISNFTGTIVEGGAALRKFFSNTFGIEFGYTLGFYKVTLDRTASGSGFLGEGFTGAFKYTVNGIRAGVVIQP